MQRHIKAIIVGIVILATLGLMALDRTHITAEVTPQVTDYSLSNQPAPDVTFTLLEGGTVTLHSLSGHTIWLHFWASWCIPCREEFGSLLERVAKSDNTILLAVSGDANAQDARAFLAPYRRNFKPLFDTGRVLIAHDPDHRLIEGVFQTFQYPETIIIGPDLAMRRKVAGIYTE